MNNDYRPNINAICSQVTQPQYLVVDPPPSTDPKPIPIAKYWRITYKVTHPTSKFGLYSSYIYHGIEVMHSRITDLSQIPDEGGILPLISADSRNVNVSVSTNYNPFKFPTITWTDITWDHYVGKIQNYVNRETRFYPGTFKHNDTTFIGDVNSIARELYPMVHYNNDRQTMISYGGMIRYTFDTDIEVNEIIYAPRYCDYCLADSDYSSKILIEYSNDGENWSTDHEYVKGVDYENGLVAHELNVSDAMFLQRDLSTGHWKPGVIKRRMRGRNPIYPNYILCNDVTCTDIVPPDTSPIMPSERNFLLKHRSTNTCLKQPEFPENGGDFTYAACDHSDYSQLYAYDYTLNHIRFLQHPTFCIQTLENGDVNISRCENDPLFRWNRRIIGNTISSNDMEFFRWQSPNTFLAGDGTSINTSLFGDDEQNRFYTIPFQEEPDSVPSLTPVPVPSPTPVPMPSPTPFSSAFTDTRSSAFTDTRSSAFTDTRSSAFTDTRSSAFTDTRSSAFTDTRSSAFTDTRSSAPSPTPVQCLHRLHRHPFQCLHRHPFQCLHRHPFKCLNQRIRLV